VFALNPVDDLGEMITGSTQRLRNYATIVAR
jgi:hypothetical protein